MAMQMAGALVAPEPIRDERGAALAIAHFEETVRPLMRAMRVARVERERALDEAGPGRDRAGLDPGPAEIPEKPPIFGPVRRQLFE